MCVELYAVTGKVFQRVSAAQSWRGASRHINTLRSSPSVSGRTSVMCICCPPTMQMKGVRNSPHKPAIVIDYNKSMGGVDLNDQKLTYFVVGHASRKWYRKIFWRIIDMSILNAFIILSECSKPNTHYRHKDFRYALCHALVQPLLDSQTSGAVAVGPGRPGPNIFRLQGKHFAYSQAAGVRRRCKVCQVKTVVTCSTCQEHVHLCLGTCFEKYHTLSKYQK